MTTQPTGTADFDSALGRIYAEFDVPSDQILQDQNLGDGFVAKVQAETGTAKDRKEVLDRLLYLRKQKRLPRLRR